MGKKVIMCDLCFDKGESNRGIIVIRSDENDRDVINAHKAIHERELRLAGKSTGQLKVTITHGRKSSVAAVKKPETPAKRGRPPSSSKAATVRRAQGERLAPRPSAVRREPPPPPPLNGPVERHCHDLLKQRREGRNVQCAECGGFLTVIHRADHIEVKYAMQHVQKHLGVQIFCCGVCEFSGQTDTVIKKHLKTIHSLGGMRENYRVMSSKSDEEQIEMLTKCFGRSYEGKRK